MADENNDQPDNEFGQLLSLARSGDNCALGQLLDNHRNFLLKIANQDLDRQIKSKVGSSDVVQESLLTAHQNFARFHGDSRNELLAWLRQILTHDLLEARRTYKGTQKRQVDREKPIQYGSHFQSPLVDPNSTPKTNALALEESQVLKAAIAELAEDHQQVIELHSWQHKSFEEVGSILGRSADACRKLWTRAILKLQQAISKQKGFLQSSKNRVHNQTNSHLE
ncbi:MAG: sigma-70 family RNA polymerase sigma factor [Planctomycetota bacterium]